MGQETKAQEFNIIMHQENEELGRLERDGESLVFSGDAEKSAKLFFDLIIKRDDSFVKSLQTQLSTKDQELADRKAATDEMNLASYAKVEELAQKLKASQEIVGYLEGFDTENTRLLNVIVACGHKFPETKEWLTDNLLAHIDTPDPLLDVKGGPNLQPPTKEK